MKQKLVLPFLAALLAVGVCGVPGGFSDVDVHDPGFQQALNFAVYEFNHHSHSKYLYKVQLVVRAQAQVVAGIRYFAIVSLTKTICTKDYEHHYCPFNSNPRMAESYGCTFSVLVPIGMPIRMESQKCRRLQ